MCLCCTTLRGVTYFMVNVHMLGSFALAVLSAHTFFFTTIEIPEGLKDVNPLFVQNFPLLIAGYGLAASLFSCFIYRAIDMESLFQLTWSVVSFGGFQFLIMFLHLVFTVTFRDLVALEWQFMFAGVLIANFLATVVYLTTLFLYGKKIHLYKYNQNIRNSIGNNVTSLIASVVKKQNSQGEQAAANSPSPTDLNLLENHPPISRTHSVCKSEDLSPPPSYHSNENDDENEVRMVVEEDDQRTRRSSAGPSGREVTVVVVGDSSV